MIQQLKNEEQAVREFRAKLEKEGITIGKKSQPSKKSKKGKAADTEATSEEDFEYGEETEGEQGKGREQELRPPNFRRRAGKPRALVLVPNRELATQVLVPLAIFWIIQY